MSVFDDDMDLGDIEVVAPGGGKFTVMTQDEADYFNDIANRYQFQNKFTNVSDLQDLGRILVMETMIWRWGLWLSQERDYTGNLIEIEEVKKSLMDYSRELRLLKKALGIDKMSRDKDKGDTVAAYIDELRRRAKEFGIMREEQGEKLITLGNELISLWTLHDNCTPDEQKENQVEMKDLLEWVRQVFIPEFTAIDDYFKEHAQRYWVRNI